MFETNRKLSRYAEICRDKQRAGGKDYDQSRRYAGADQTNDSKTDIDHSDRRGYMDIDGFIDGTFNTSFLKLNPVEQEKSGACEESAVCEKQIKI